MLNVTYTWGNTPINMNNVLILHVEGYVSLGQHYLLNENNHNKEIQLKIVEDCRKIRQIP